ncbi:hypothetical protein DFR42_107258 [Undibacterium pigrum]|uniref:ATP-dependent protease ClpP protease subunit n=2 Tax=Undibacterium pigrum TaxID=401470 RepID=A0A318J5H8_9BURK|nr:hypothetical protein DFR42_107258 [Undibacterium pigrum]
MANRCLVENYDKQVKIPNKLQACGMSKVSNGCPSLVSPRTYRSPASQGMAFFRLEQQITKASTRIIQSSIFLATFLLSSTTLAEDIAPLKRFEISGIISKSEIERFDQFVKANRDISEILLADSPGGYDDGTSTVFEFKKRIDELKLKTFARGFCASTCAYIFLLGHERTLLANPAGKKTMLLLHPVRWIAKDDTGGVGQIQVQYTDKLNKAVSERSEGKITTDLLDKMYSTDDSSGGIFILREVNSENKSVLFSPSIKKRIKAIPFSDLSPQDLGIRIAD